VRAHVGQTGALGRVGWLLGVDRVRLSRARPTFCQPAANLSVSYHGLSEDRRERVLSSPTNARCAVHRFRGLTWLWYIFVCGLSLFFKCQEQIRVILQTLPRTPLLHGGRQGSVFIHHSKKKRLVRAIACQNISRLKYKAQ